MWLLLVWLAKRCSAQDWANGQQLSVCGHSMSDRKGCAWLTDLRNLGIYLVTILPHGRAKHCTSSGDACCYARCSSCTCLMYLSLCYLRAGMTFPSWPFHLDPHISISSAESISSARFHLASRISSISSIPSAGIRPASRVSSSPHLPSCPSSPYHLRHPGTSRSWMGIPSISSALLPSKNGDRNMGVHIFFRPC